MQLGGLAGIAGLAPQPDGGQSKQRELATMQALEQSVKMDEAESLKMQELEAQEYEKISEMSSALLQRDRDKINDKALGLQNNIREQIKRYGSKKDFYANGGLALLKGYKSDLLNSEETSAYKENKQNLDMIYKMQLAGKGHLVSPRDIKAMQDYQNGTGDRVTYSGMMNELEYPQDLYNFGEDISLENILRHKDNYAKIAANYFIENPDMKNLPKAELDNQLLGFMKKMGYGAKGTDKDKMKMQADMALKMLEKEKEKYKSEGTGKEPQISYTSELRGLKASIMNKADGSPVTTSDIMGKDYVSQLKKDGDTRPNILFGDNLSKNKSSHKERSNKAGNLYNADYFQLSSSNDIFPYAKDKLNGLLGIKGETGEYEFQLSPADTYKATGQKLSSDEIDSGYIEHGNTLFGNIFTLSGKRKAATGTVIGIHSAFKSSNGNLVTELIDSKGKPKNEKDVRDHRSTYEGQNAEMTFVAAIRDKDGTVVYKEIDVDNMQALTDIQDKLGSSDNVTDVVKQSQSIQRKMEYNQAQMDKNAGNIQEAVSYSSQNGLFSSDDFIAEAQTLQTSSRAVQRTSLLKSFYAGSAVNGQGELNSKMINNTQKAGKLKMIVEQYPSLQEAIINPNINNDKFMDMFLETVNKLPNGEPETPETIQNNTLLVDRWRKINKIINQKKQ